MNISNNILFFFSSLGAFNGLIAGSYFLFFSRKKTLSNIFLGALLIALSIRIGKSVAYFFDYDVPKTLLQIGLTACLFIGPFLYFFVKTEVARVKKMPASWTRQLIGWSSSIVVFGLVCPYKSFPGVWTSYVIPIIYLQWGVYICSTVALLLPSISKIVRRQRVQPFEKWLVAICLATLLIFIAYVWSFTGITKGSYITGPLYFSFVTYLTIFVLLYRRKADDLSSFVPQKYGNKKTDKEKIAQLLVKLEHLMKDKKLFRNPNLKMENVAGELGIPAYQLSRLLNEALQKNFTQFVNEYRIEAACQMLLGENNITIEAIGVEVGFSSKSTFFVAFKKVKGLTPKAYVREMTPIL